MKKMAEEGFKVVDNLSTMKIAVIAQNSLNMMMRRLLA